MGRVLRIGAMIMGVLLVVMTAGLWMRRATTEPEYGMVFVQDSEDGTSALILRVPELNYVRQITASFDEIGTFYYVDYYPKPLLVSEVGSDTLTLYHFRSDTGELKAISTGGLGHSVMLAPHDPRWLLYEEQDSIDDNIDCHLLNIQTGERRDLGDLFPQDLEGNCMGFTSDSQWVQVYIPNDDARSDYRFIRLSDGLVLNLYERFGEGHVLLWSLDERWVIGEMRQGYWENYRVYRTDPDNIQWQPLINASPAVLSTQSYSESLEEWLPEYNLLVVRVDYDENNIHTIAVPYDGGSPVWIARNLYYEDFLDYPEWLFFKSRASDKLYRMRPDGTNFTMIADLPSGYYLRWEQFIEDQSGSSWLYLELRPEDIGQYAIWRMHPDGSSLESVVSHDSSIRIGSVSPDHQWMLLYARVDESWGKYYRARLEDGSDKQFVLADPHSYFLDWSLSPTKPSQPVLFLIVGIGLIGISIFGKRPYQIIRHRLRRAA